MLRLDFYHLCTIPLLGNHNYVILHIWPGRADDNDHGSNIGRCACMSHFGSLLRCKFHPRSGMFQHTNLQKYRALIH